MQWHLGELRVATCEMVVFVTQQNNYEMSLVSKAINFQVSAIGCNLKEPSTISDEQSSFNGMSLPQHAPSYSHSWEVEDTAPSFFPLGRYSENFPFGFL